jgi:hypothetical protein
MSMEQVAWAATGLLAAGFFTTFGMFLHVSSKIDSGLSALSQRMDVRFDRVDSRFDAMNARVDALSTQLQVHIERHAS